MIDFLRWVIMALSAACTIGAVLWVRRNRRFRWMMIAPTTVVVHVALFHAARLLHLSIPVATLNAWSSVIHLHITLLVLIGLYIYWRPETFMTGER